jgi:hypothetical protein
MAECFAMTITTRQTVILAMGPDVQEVTPDGFGVKMEADERLDENHNTPLFKREPFVYRSDDSTAPLAGRYA